MLLPGDVESAGESALLASGAALSATLLLLPHHGSNSSSGAAFLAAVSPTVAIASAGFRNRWGFPDPRVRSRVLAQGAQLLSTAGQGQVQVRLGGRTGVQVQRRRKTQRRVWRTPASAAWNPPSPALSSPNE